MPRASITRGMLEISIGDYVLSGGELAALTLLDSCVRLLPGVMGAAESAAEESHGAEGLLEYPHYTRPAEWAGRAVPEVLLSGHHAAIAAWRRAESENITNAAPIYGRGMKRSAGARGPLPAIPPPPKETEERVST